MKIGFDVDDVVLDLLGEWCWRIRKELGKVECFPEELRQWAFYEDFDVTADEAFSLLTPDIYATVDAFPGAAEVLDAVEAMGHEVVFVTSCGTAEMYNAKVERMLDLGLAKNRRIVPVGAWAEYSTKAAVPVDWLVDDHIGNVEPFPGHALLLTRPHNRNLQTTRKRIKKLGDVVAELKYTPQWYQHPTKDAVSNVPFAEGSKPTNPKDAIGSDKLPLHLWPETATAMGCLGFLEGALKYGRSNFRAIGVRSSIYVDAARRHLNKWFEGEDTDPESGLPHLAHALACIAIVVDAQAAGKLNDDRQVQGGYTQLLQELTPHVRRLKDKYADMAPKHYTIADKVA